MLTRSDPVGAVVERPLVAWPGWKHLGEAVWLGLLFATWLELVYASTDYLTALRTTRVRLHFDWELALPFVPAMAISYLSIFPLFWLAPFVLRSRAELRALVKAMSWAVIGAGIGFLLLPAELAYSPLQIPAAWAVPYTLADWLNLRYNLAPSLHVALSAVCVHAYARRASLPAKVALWTWGATIATSTLLTHQHHVLDVVSGLLLAILVSRWPSRKAQTPLIDGAK